MSRILLCGLGLGFCCWQACQPPSAPYTTSDSDGGNETLNNGGSVPGETGSDTTLLWSESWELASRGDKRNFESFDADRPGWGVSKYDTIPTIPPIPAPCGTSRVWIDDGQRLCLSASAQASGGICDFVSVDADVSGGRSVFCDEQVYPMVLLTRNTMFSGDFSYEVNLGSDGVPREHEEAYAVIVLDVGLYQINYVHRNSRSSQEQFSTIRPIIVLPSDHFERNVFDDLVTLYGQHFVTIYETYQDSPDWLVEGGRETGILLRIENYVHELPYGLGSAESTACFDNLRFWEVGR